MSKTKSDSKTQMVLPQDQAIATAPEVESFLEGAAGAGLEGIGVDEQIIPTLLILQALSPQLDENSPKYAEGAVKGAFFNTLTAKCYDGKFGIEVAVLHFERCVVEYVSRDLGGGFVAKHPTMDVALQLAKDASNALIETYQYYLAIFPDDPAGQLDYVLFGCSSTKLQPARQWNTVMNTQRHVLGNGKVITPPAYYRKYRLTTFGTQNKKGQPYHNFTFAESDKIADVELLAGFEDFRRKVQFGDVKVHDASQTPSAVSDEPTY